MPLKQCTVDGKSGWKWGDSGKCYTGANAKEKALAQGRAIAANKGMKQVLKSFIDALRLEYFNVWEDNSVVEREVKEKITTNSRNLNAQVKDDAKDKIDINEDGIMKELTKTAVFKGFNVEKGLVYGVVYEPSVYDAHEHWTSMEEIEKAAHNYLPNSMLNIDHESDLSKTQAVIVESFIAPTDFQYEGSNETILKGSWVLVTKVFDEKLKKALKEGEITGYSLEGTAFLVEEK